MVLILADKAFAIAWYALYLGVLGYALCEVLNRAGKVILDLKVKKGHAIVGTMVYICRFCLSVTKWCGIVVISMGATSSLLYFFSS